MVTMHSFVLIVFLCLSIKNTHSQIAFQSVCSPEVYANGLTSVDGNDEFEIDIGEGKFLPDDTITCKNKKKQFFFMEC